MTGNRWKPGQTCVYKGAWGYVAFILGEGDQAIINLDNLDQRRVQVADLEDPRISADGGPVATVQYAGLSVELR